MQALLIVTSPAVAPSKALKESDSVLQGIWRMSQFAASSHVWFAVPVHWALYSDARRGERKAMTQQGRNRGILWTWMSGGYEPERCRQCFLPCVTQLSHFQRHFEQLREIRVTEEDVSLACQC